MMIASLIKFALANYALTFLVIGMVCAAVAIFRGKKNIFEALLAYYCLFAIGLTYLYNFIMHVFFARMSAAFIGWADSPFQLEVGFASLGFGVVGLLAFRQDFGLRLAAVTGPAFFLWGAAGGHVYQMMTQHNFAPGNAGVIFWMDILEPILGFLFLWGWRKTNAPA